MEQEYDMGELNQLSVDLTAMILPWMGVILSVIIAIWLKDFATNAAKGWAFKSNQSFNEGDHIILDGRDAIIDKGYTWRYISNDRLAGSKIEKIINKNLHLDTEAEKGMRIQRMIDASQNNMIKENEQQIRENKKKIEELKDKK